MKYNPVEVGNRIRNARNALGMSQESFAEALGIGCVHLAKIEVGMRNPSIDLLIDNCITLFITIQKNMIIRL